MDSRKRVRNLLKQAKQALGIRDGIKLVLYPMKYNVASISLKTRTIRLNKNLVELFADDELYYILVHELIHVKLETLNHGEEFYKFLYTLYTPDKCEEIENRIIKKLINANVRTKRWIA